MDLQDLLHTVLDFDRTWVETGCAVERTPYGSLVRNDRYPLVFMGNLAWIERLPRGGVDAVLADLDRNFAGTSVRHRHLVFEDAQEAFENQEDLAALGFAPQGERALAKLGLPACIVHPDVELREVGAGASEDVFRGLKLRLFEELGMGPEEARQVYALERDRRGALGVQAYVGYLKGDPAATVSVWPRPPFALLEGVATMPEFRGKGVGRTVLFDAAKRAAAAQCEYSLLTTDLLGSPQAMYQTLGYQPIGEIRGFLKADRPSS